MADPIMIPDGALNLKLTSLRDTIFAPGSLRLFKNNKTPAAGDDTALYQECDFSGYAAQPLNDLGVVTVSGGVASTTSGLHTYSHNGGPTSNPVYGWFLTDTSNRLLAASRSATGPVTLSAVGQTYAVQLTLTDQRAP